MATMIGAVNPSWRMQTPMFDGAAGDGTGQAGAGAAGVGAGAGGGTGTGTAQNDGTASGQNAGAGSGQGAGAGAGAGAGDKTYSFKEDRTDWVPPHRVSAQSRQIKALETQIKELGEGNQGFQNKLRQAFGIDEPTGEAKELAETKAALFKVFPNLKVLETLDEQKLNQIIQGATSAQQMTQRQWERHATSIFGTVAKEVAKGLGIDKLSDTQRDRLEDAYRSDAMRSVRAREAAFNKGERTTMETLPTDNDFLARHEKGDETLITEFVKGYLGDWFEPARRFATTEAARRFRPVPRGERTRTPVTSNNNPQLDLTKEDDFKKALLAARGQS